MLYKVSAQSSLASRESLFRLREILAWSQAEGKKCLEMARIKLVEVSEVLEYIRQDLFRKTLFESTDTRTMKSKSAQFLYLI